MKIKNLVCCLGFTLCLCSCEEKEHETPPETQDADKNTPETEQETESFNYAKEFSELTPQSLAESEEGFNLFHAYVADARRRAIKSTTYRNPDTSTEYSRESVDHSLLSDKCEYVFEDDPHGFRSFIPEDWNNRVDVTNYSFEKKSENNYVVKSSMQDQMGEYSCTLEADGDTIAGTIGHPGSTYTSNYSMVSGHSADACIGNVGLADKLLLNIRYDIVEILNTDITFSEEKDYLAEMYFKVTNDEAIARVRYNTIFDCYNEETGGANYVPGRAGYNEDRDGPLRDGEIIGQTIQEIKFKNYLVTYYNVYFELKGKTDYKYKFMRTK